MKARLLRPLIGFAMTGWFTFLVFCALVQASHHLVFLPADIRGQTNFTTFRIVAQSKLGPRRIVSCSFEPGPARALKLDELASRCSFPGDKAFEIGSLRMSAPSGRIPLVEEEPDYGWTRYEVLAEDDGSQLIETETYSNSDGLVTRYRVSGDFVEAVGQINQTRGLNQMYALFVLPMMILFAVLATSLLRRLIRRFVPFRDGPVCLVKPSRAARESGFRKGDLLLAFNGTTINGAEHLRELLWVNELGVHAYAVSREGSELLELRLDRALPLGAFRSRRIWFPEPDH